MIVKRRKREKRKIEPYAGSTISGMKVGMEDKAGAGWKQPITETEPAIDGKVPQGQAKGNVKGKDLKEEEI